MREKRGEGEKFFLERRARGSRKIREKARIRARKLLGKHPRFGDYGDEAGVSGPAGQDVHVQMMGDAGTGGAAEVEPEVEPVGMILGVEGVLAALRQLEKLVQLRAGGVSQKWNVAVGYDQHVAGGVGEQIENDVAAIAAEEDQVLGVSRLRENRTEHTNCGGLVEVADVVESPGSPESIH